MKRLGLILPLVFMFLLNSPVLKAADSGADFIFASDTAEKFVSDFFMDTDADKLVKSSIASTVDDSFGITLDEYKKVFLDKGPKSKRYIKVKTIKAIEPFKDKSYCYFTVKLKPRVFSNRARKIYALRITCVREKGVWKVLPDQNESSVIAEPFSMLFSKVMKRGQSIRTAERQASEIISLDAEKMLALARHTQNLLQQAKIEATYGDAAAAAETYKKVLEMEPENKTALEGMEQLSGNTSGFNADRTELISSKRTRRSTGKFITQDAFENKIDELMDEISKTQKKSNKESRDFVTKDEIDKKLETIITKLQENPPAQTQPSAVSAPKQSAPATVVTPPAKDAHKTMVEGIIARGEKLFQDKQYRRAIIEFQKASTIDPGNKRAETMMNLCRKSLEME